MELKEELENIMRKVALEENNTYCSEPETEESDDVIEENYYNSDSEQTTDEMEEDNIWKNQPVYFGKKRKKISLQFLLGLQIRPKI